MNRNDMTLPYTKSFRGNEKGKKIQTKNGTLHYGHERTQRSCKEPEYNYIET